MKKAWLIPLHLFGIEPNIDPDPPNRPSSPGGDWGDAAPETVETFTFLKTDSVSPSNEAAKLVSGAQVASGNRETKKPGLGKNRILPLTDADDDFSEKLVPTSQNSVSSVSLAQPTTERGFPPETASVSFGFYPFHDQVGSKTTIYLVLLPCIRPPA